MKSINKNLLYLFFIFNFILVSPTHAGYLKINSFSQPIKTNNKISQQLNINLSASNNYKLYAQALDNKIYCQNKDNYSIPIERLEILDSRGLPISNFILGKNIQIPQQNSNDNIILNLNLSTFDNDRVGFYSTDIKFTLIDSNNTMSEAVYNFRFNKEEISSIEFSEPTINLKLDKDMILKKKAEQHLLNPLVVYIKSNKNWKLYIRKIPNTEKKLTYYIKPIFADTSVKLHQSSEYIPLKDSESILIASGKATFNDTLKTLDKRIINTDYLVKGPNDKYIEAGKKFENFQYILETED